MLESHAVVIEVIEYGPDQSYRVAAQELPGPRSTSISETQVDSMTLEPEDVELKLSVEVQFQAD